jgi:F-type H+-transporting ATPase subunit c
MGLFSIFPTFLAEITSLGPLAAIGAGIAIFGAAKGIGAIGERACDAIGRQPEAKGAIQTAMIISAALIEGATFFALVICMMGLDK